MKAVLISIKPKWVEKIAIGKKTIEVRKSRPKLETPFKCYIHCTKAKNKEERLILQPFGYALGGLESNLTYRSDGKVIGEFVCDRIIEIGNYQEVDHSYRLWVKDRETTNKVCKYACLSEFEIQDYLGENGGYGWHISNLVVYDEPKELSEFFHYCEKQPCQTNCWKCDRYDYIGNACLNAITRPPESWRYIDV